MQNISQNARRCDDGKSHHTKGKVGPVHKEQQKHMFDSKSDQAAQKSNGYNGYSAYSGPAPVSGSSGFKWAKSRKPDASSILSDGSRSKISVMDPTFAKGTYDLTKHSIEVSERRHNYNRSNGDEISKRVVKKQQGRNVESFDVADIYNSNYFMDFDLTDKPDTQMNPQVGLISQLHRIHFRVTR